MIVSGLAVSLELIMGFKKKKNFNGDLVTEFPKEETIRILIGKSPVIPKRVFELLKPHSLFPMRFIVANKLN